MGKIDKFRECPAIGRRIKPVECGQNRGKNYACPPECPHCPWAVANYDDFLDIEGEIDTKTIGFFIDVVGKDSSREKLRVDSTDGSEEGELIFQSACYREFFHRELEPGKLLYDLWREAGWKGLTRDEPFLAGFKTKVRPTLLEVRRVIDDLQVECADLLDESAGVFVVCDRGMAKGALQFQCLMGWVAAYPFFSRMHGSAYTLPPGDEPGLDLVRRHVRALGGPKNGPISDWLFENFYELHGHIMEECQKSMKAMFRNTDFKECVAVYRLTARPGDLMLDGREDFEPTDPNEESLKKHGNHKAYVWLRTGQSQRWESELPEALRGGLGGPGLPIWGNMRVFPKRVEITALSENYFRPMQKMVEAFFGDILVFEKESVSDLAKQTWPEHENEAPAQRRLAVSTSLVPEGIKDVGEVMQEIFHSHYKKFLDDRIPALDNMTPREAAGRPEMRDRLVNLMKGHLQTMDGHSKKDGRIYDIGWVLDELALGEMNVPARAVSATHSEDWWEEIGEEEFADRLQSGIADPEGCRTIEDFPPIAEYFDKLAPVLLNSKEQDSLILLVNCAIGVLLPEDVVPGPIEEAEMIRATETVFEQIIPKVATPLEFVDPIKSLAEISVQPAILSFAAMLFISQTKTNKLAGLIPFGKKVRLVSVVPMLVQIEAFLRCLRKSSLV